MKNHIKMGGKGGSGVYVSSRGLQQLPTSILKEKRGGKREKKLIIELINQTGRSLTSPH